VVKGPMRPQKKLLADAITAGGGNKVTLRTQAHVSGRVQMHVGQHFQVAACRVEFAEPTLMTLKHFNASDIQQ
jgi:hypothetical protein